MEVTLLRVIERHQILMLAVHKQIKLKEAAKQLGLSLRHTKRLVRELRGAYCAHHLASAQMFFGVEGISGISHTP